jgi:hypothetical protein
MVFIIMVATWIRISSLQNQKNGCKNNHVARIYAKALYFSALIKILSYLRWRNVIDSTPVPLILDELILIQVATSIMKTITVYVPRLVVSALRGSRTIYAYDLVSRIGV